MKLPIVLIYTLIFICTSVITQAQTYTYQPIPTQNASWKLAVSYWYPPGHASPEGRYCKWNEYSFSGKDTVVSSIIYHEIEVKESGIRPSNEDCVDNSFQMHITSSTHYYVWLSQKGKKVFVSHKIPVDTIRDLVYDFDAFQKLGDTLYFLRPFMITHIDTVNINGSLRKRIALSSPTVPSRDTIVEGIGSYKVGVFTYLYSGLQTRPELICYTTNNISEYVYNNSACIGMWPTEIEGLELEEVLEVSPNPFNDVINIKTKDRSTISIYNNLGQLVHSENNLGKKEIALNTLSWSSGVYFIHISSSTKNQTRTIVKY